MFVNSCMILEVVTSLEPHLTFLIRKMGVLDQVVFKLLSSLTFADFKVRQDDRVIPPSSHCGKHVAFS